jgi:hypothetical protein
LIFARSAGYYTIVALLLIFLAFVICALAAPVIIGIALVVRKRTGAGISVLCVYAALVSAFLVEGIFAPRSAPGRIIRWGMGSGLAKQEVKDQASDLRHSPTLPKIQSWAVDTMQQFLDGKVRTNVPASYWSLGSVQLVPSEIPEYVLAQWKDGPPPEISIRLSPSGTPECVVVAWYLKGVAIGDIHYQSPSWQAFYAEQAAPGVYAYHLYK